MEMSQIYLINYALGLWNNLDLVAPIGISLLAFILCLWGALKTDKIAGKVVSIITGVVFLAAIPLWYLVRYEAQKYDYESTYGIFVRQGIKNKCEKKDVDEWSKWVVDFWSKDYDSSIVSGSLKGKFLVCLDEEKLTLSDRYVRGYSSGNVVGIGWNPKPKYVEALFKHEMSHQVLNRLGADPSEDVHHQLFSKKKLGY